MPGQITKLSLFLFLFAGLGLAAAKPASAYGGDYCREYTRTVTIGNRIQEAYGKACLQPDGSWMIVGEGFGPEIPPAATDVDYIIYDRGRYIRPPRVEYYPTAPQINVYKYTRPAYVWHPHNHYKKGRGHHYARKKHYRHHHRHWREN